MPIRLPDVSRSRHPLSRVLHRANTLGYIHRALYVLRASPRICCSRHYLRDTFLAIPRLNGSFLCIHPTRVALHTHFYRNYQ